MDFEVPAATLAALLLGVARATGFVLLAPPFNSRSIPAPVKAAFAMALSLLLFVVVDGWALITTALVGSYGGSG